MDKNALKIRIEKKIKNLLIDIESLEESCKPIAPDVAIGRISRMDAINNKSVMEASLRNATKKLNGLQIALKNIDTDDFGICLKCNQPILEGRLFILPESRFCVKCS